MFFFFFSSRRRHTRFDCDWSSDVCSSDLCEQPGFGVLRQAVSRPGLECGNERFAEGILSARHVVRVDGKIRHQTAVGFSGHALYGPPYGALDVLLTAFIHPVNPRRMASGASGRTSTAPIDAPGHRAEIGRAHVELQSQSNLVCRLLLEKKKSQAALPPHPHLLHDNADPRNDTLTPATHYMR